MNEKTAILGIGAGLALVYGSIFMGSGVSTFFDPAALLIVLGGTLSALAVNFNMEELKSMPELLKEFIQFEDPDYEAYVDQYSQFSRTARREGLLALDRELEEMDDEFTRTGLEMAIDGLEIQEIQEMMHLKMKEEVKDRQLGPDFFNKAGTYAPAFGMIGTLIGLIQMLQNLNDPTQIGAGMSTALVTTFYGALFANLIFLPLSEKMRNQVESVKTVRQMSLTGILAIVRGESPTLIERKLNLFVAEETDEEVAEVEEETPLSKAA